MGTRCEVRHGNAVAPGAPLVLANTLPGVPKLLAGERQRHARLGLVIRGAGACQLSGICLRLVHPSAARQAPIHQGGRPSHALCATTIAAVALPLAFGRVATTTPARRFHPLRVGVGALPNGTNGTNGTNGFQSPSCRGRSAPPLALRLCAALVSFNPLLVGVGALPKASGTWPGTYSFQAPSCRGRSAPTHSSSQRPETRGFNPLLVGVGALLPTLPRFQSLGREFQSPSCRGRSAPCDSSSPTHNASFQSPSCRGRSAPAARPRVQCRGEVSIPFLSG